MALDFWRPVRSIAVLGITLAAAAPGLSAQGAPRPAEFEVSVQKNVMVRMRDGVHMATDLYLPARGGRAVAQKFPVLLARTPYNKDGMESDGRFFAERGYAVAVQDVRGRYGSEGTFYIYLNEAKDGHDAVEWAAAQPWSSGEVGTFGGSYLAGTQNSLAIERPPHLRGMFITVSTSNYFEDGAARGGAFALLHNVAYAFNLATNSQEAAASPGLRAGLEKGWQQDMGEWLRAYPYRPNASPFVNTPYYQKWFQDWVEHSSYDDYWKQVGYDFESYHDRYPDIPVYYIGGWYDIFLRGTLNNHAGLARLKESPQKLMIGPWEHGVGPRATGDVDFGPTAAVDIRAEQLRWFDQILQKRETGVLSEPRVRLFVMGGGEGRKNGEGKLSHGGEWVGVDAWPVPQATPTPFYLHADGRLDRQPPTQDAPPSRYAFDPRNPVPTIGGQINSGDNLVPSGPYDQRCIEGKLYGCDDDLPLSARRDVLVFQTPPLEADVVVNGPITVKLWVGSSALDTDFTAKLVDVYPPGEDYPGGYDLLLADRIVRARFRNGLEREELMRPGEVYEIEIDLLGVANRFPKGHRIRLDVSSSNFPFFDVNPNTGERIGHHTHMVEAINAVFHDRARPSHVVLPLMPATRAPTR